MKTRILILLMICCSLPLQARQISELELIANPTLDARELYDRGVREFVGIQLDSGMLVPGIEKEQRPEIEKQYKIRALNKRWKTFSNIEHDKDRLHDLRIYANRFNITMWRLIEAEKNKPKRIYRY